MDYITKELVESWSGVYGRISDHYCTFEFEGLQQQRGWYVEELRSPMKKKYLGQLYFITQGFNPQLKQKYWIQYTDVFYYKSAFELMDDYSLSPLNGLFLNNTVFCRLDKTKIEFIKPKNIVKNNKQIPWHQYYEYKKDKILDLGIEL